MLDFNPEINAAIEQAERDPTRQHLEGIALAALNYTSVEAAWWRVQDAFRQYKQTVSDNLEEASDLIRRWRPQS